MRVYVCVRVISWNHSIQPLTKKQKRRRQQRRWQQKLSIMLYTQEKERQQTGIEHANTHTHIHSQIHTLKRTKRTQINTHTRMSKLSC